MEKIRKWKIGFLNFSIVRGVLSNNRAKILSNICTNSNKSKVYSQEGAQRLLQHVPFSNRLKKNKDQNVTHHNLIRSLHGCFTISTTATGSTPLFRQSCCSSKAPSTDQSIAIHTSHFGRHKVKSTSLMDWVGSVKFITCSRQRSAR
jgi:hypothetical protein